MASGPCTPCVGMTASLPTLGCFLEGSFASAVTSTSTANRRSLSPSSSFTGSLDGTLRIWDLEKGINMQCVMFRSLTRALAIAPKELAPGVFGLASSSPDVCIVYLDNAGGLSQRSLRQVRQTYTHTHIIYTYTFLAYTYTHAHTTGAGGSHRRCQ